MQRIVHVARVLLGLPLIVFGLNGFLHFMEMPEMEGRAAEFIAALHSSGYLWELKDAIELGAGLMILSGFFLPLGLTIVAPILVNIAAFHIFVEEPANGALGYLMCALALFLAWAYRPSFGGVLAPRGRTRFQAGGT